MKPYAFGVDIGGTAVKIGLFSTDGIMETSFEIPTRIEDQGKNILPDIWEAIKKHMEEKGISVDQLEGIGLGVPGPVTDEGIVKKCVNLGWGEFNVARTMEELTGIRTKAANDANVAALGEQWKGAARGHEDAVTITLGTGVGCGIIVGGKIISGADGSAGEFGHVCVSDNEEEKCNCGHKGCLEQYASATGIVRMTKRYLNDNPDQKSNLRKIKNVTAKDVFDAAKVHDPAALAILDEFSEILGKALANLTAILNPEVIVIGGGVSNAGRILLDALQDKYKKYAFPAAADTLLCLAELGNYAGMTGGVALLL